MKNKLNNHLLTILFAGLFLLAAAACKQSPGEKANEEGNPAAAATPPMTMEQTADGKWVIMDGQKTARYDVFIYDNGPDYEAEGLIRVVKNGKIGYADAKTFTIVIEPQFDCAFPFENGKAKVSNQCRTIQDGEHSIWESNNWQYVDKAGKLTAVPDEQ